jgi:hypothetical protein
LYSAILLLHLSVFAVVCRRATYLSLMAEGDVSIVAALAPEMSLYTFHGVSLV